MIRLPSLTPKQLIAALQRAGLDIVDDDGKHTRLWRQGLPRPVMVPRHNKEMRRGTMADIIKQAGLTQDDFRKHIR
jgi:predicted RNA binding protein YcfA (HicA-like mRNA interferase family)